MADSKNALKSIVVWLNDIFKIIAQQLQDGDAKIEVLNALGLDINGADSLLTIPADSLASIQQYVDKSDDDIDIEAFLSVVDDVIKVSNAIDDFIKIVTNEDPEIAADFLDMILQLYLMDAARLRINSNEAKRMFQVLQVLNFYQELAEPSGGISQFTVNIGKFIKQVFTSFNAENDDEAALASDTIFVAIAAASYKFDFIRDNLKVSYGFDPSPNGYDLRLMSATEPDGLVGRGRSLVIVALINALLHIRIFDASGKKVVDKAESELLSGEALIFLRQRLNPLPDESDLSQEDKQEIIKNATSSAGHTPPNSTSPVANLISERTLTMSLSYKVKDPVSNKLAATLIVSTAVRPQTQQGGGIEVLLAGGGKFERKFGDWKFSIATDGVVGVDWRTKANIKYVGGSYDINASVFERPSPSAVVLKTTVATSFSFPVNLSGSKATANVKATNVANFTLKKNDSDVGTIKFDADENEATFDTSGSEVKFTAGDVLEILAPSSQDSTLADISIILVTVSEERSERLPLVIGDTKGTHFKVGDTSFEIKGSAADNDFGVKLGIKEGAFALAKGKTDGFINSILPDKGVYGSFDLGIGYSLRKSIYVDGGSGLTVFIPLHTSLGPLLLNSFYLKLAGNEDEDGVLLETSIGLSTKFLGFSASVERIGLLHNLSLPEEGDKNLGFVNYDIGFKPPNSVGLSIDTGVLKGGGFLYFDPDKEEYFGALELSFKDKFDLKAIGVINTKLPDGSPGFSLLIIITAEFSPIQLGFGITLNGVGGLLGLNRTANIDVLRQGIKTNVLNSILFPTDVVANMSRIISDLKQVFPPLNDRLLIMPMGKLGYGTPSFITLEVGLLFEMPLSRIAILGVLKALLPNEKKALLRLQVNFLGIVDFENKFISFDASLYDSRLLTFTLTGDMAFRLFWGGEGSTGLLSVGGFHPAFKEAPGDLQNMTRLTLSLLSGENPRITSQCYIAVTSNTVQFGSRSELYAAAAGFNVYGFFGYDCLFQIKPFKFIAGFDTGLALRRGSSVIMGIRVSGELSGPTPWNARGEASFSILFFDATICFNETWGVKLSAITTVIEDLIRLLMQEIEDNRNWKADPPENSNLHVSIKKLELPPDKLAIHPFGVLTFSERLVPLDATISKFGSKVPKDANRFEIKPTDNGIFTQPTTEQFAPANFFTLNDSDKLSRPSFEHMKSGFKLVGTSTLIVPATINKSVDYEFTYLRKKRELRVFGGIYRFMKTLFKTNLRAGAIANCSLSFTNKRTSSNAPEQVQVKGDGYAIVSIRDMKLHHNSKVAGSYTEAADSLAQLIAEDPSLRAKVQIVAEYERAA